MKIHKSNKPKTIMLTFHNRRVRLIDNILYYRWNGDGKIIALKVGTSGVTTPMRFNDVSKVTDRFEDGKMLLSAYHPKVGAHHYNSPLQLLMAASENKIGDKEATEDLPKSHKTIAEYTYDGRVTATGWKFKWVMALPRQTKNS
jgi:hypothetical protein